MIALSSPVPRVQGSLCHPGIRTPLSSRWTLCSSEVSAWSPHVHFGVYMGQDLPDFTEPQQMPLSWP